MGWNLTIPRTNLIFIFSSVIKADHMIPKDNLSFSDEFMYQKKKSNKKEWSPQTEKKNRKASSD